MKKVSKILQIQFFPTLLARALTYNRRTHGCHHHRADKGKANTCHFCLHDRLLLLLETLPTFSYTMSVLLGQLTMRISRVTTCLIYNTSLIIICLEI